MDLKIKNEFDRWIKYAIKDVDLVDELMLMSEFEEKILDAFYADLTFGTGGLRGIIGAGTNRVNVYTIAKASQGLANYIIKNFEADNRKIAVSYDSRIKSDLFARVASEIFSANNILVYIYDELMPTPCLSFAVRELNCAAGIMVTASHNPSKYNGYKVYGQDGCQITTEAAEDIFIQMQNVDIFSDVKEIPFDEAIKNGKIKYIDSSIYSEFINKTKNESLLTDNILCDKSFSIVYTPLNGAGLKPILRVLTESGYTNIKIVEEQRSPDGNFPTCPFPNPEIEDTMALGIEYAKKYDADLLLATDPDCDRVGVVVRDDENKYQLLSGNEIGILLLNYICSRKIKVNKMPENPVFVKTIVTTDLAEKVAEQYGVKTINVLTGFKFIGEQIGCLERLGRESSFIFGFEESCGYLSGTYIRDKDAVDGVFLICEMFSYYKSKGISLLEKLEEIYINHGYCLDTLHSYQFEGIEGIEKMKSIMGKFRNNKIVIDNQKIFKFIDYMTGVDNLPNSDIIKLVFENGNSIVVRPSGTEPKLKIYLSVQSNTSDTLKLMESELHEKVNHFINS